MNLEKLPLFYYHLKKVTIIKIILGKINIT